MRARRPVPRMRWTQLFAAGLALALLAAAISVDSVSADDCNRQAPDDFRSDVAWDGTGLHHQPQAVQSLFARIWGTADDLSGSRATSTPIPASRWSAGETLHRRVRSRVSSRRRSCHCSATWVKALSSGAN